MRPRIDRGSLIVASVVFVVAFRVLGSRGINAFGCQHVLLDEPYGNRIFFTAAVR